jgi:hypothetical protein
MDIALVAPIGDQQPLDMAVSLEALSVARVSRCAHFPANEPQVSSILGNKLGLSSTCVHGTHLKSKGVADPAELMIASTADSLLGETRPSSGRDDKCTRLSRCSPSVHSCGQGPQESHTALIKSHISRRWIWTAEFLRRSLPFRTLPAPLAIQHDLMNRQDLLASIRF